MELLEDRVCVVILSAVAALALLTPFYVICCVCMLLHAPIVPLSRYQGLELATHRNI